MHPHDLGGVPYRHTGRFRVFARSEMARDRLLVTYQNDVDAVQPGALRRTPDDLTGSVVTAHRIDSDFHKSYTSLLLVSL